MAHVFRPIGATNHYPMTQSLMVVTGEASGDQHAARVVEALRERELDFNCFGLGGDQLIAGGFESLGHSREIAVVGLFEVFKILKRAREIFRSLVQEAERRRPRAVLLVDAPDFNLRLAKKLKKLGIPVIYYVSPQVWAWRQGRVKTIADRVDKMLVLFPFEENFYRGHNVDVHHVGHPLVDEVAPQSQIWDRNPHPPYRIALLPGSRRSEMNALLPELLSACAVLNKNTDITVHLMKASSIDSQDIATHLQAFPDLSVEVVAENRFSEIADSHLALCASGTAALEVGLLTTPMIVVYKLQRWTYLLGRLLVDLPHFSLVNLVLGHGAVPEMIQREANGPLIAEKARELLKSPDRIATMRSKLKNLRPKLGEGGASSRVAEILYPYLSGK